MIYDFNNRIDVKPVETGGYDLKPASPTLSRLRQLFSNCREAVTNASPP